MSDLSGGGGAGVGRRGRDGGGGGGGDEGSVRSGTSLARSMETEGDAVRVVDDDGDRGGLTERSAEDMSPGGTSAGWSATTE